MTETTPADIIARQLGTGTIYMFGARGRCTCSVDGLELTLRIRGSRRCNTITIVLAPNDTYTVRFRKVTMARFNPRTGALSKGQDRTVAEHTDVYAQDLHRTIEAETGLATRL